jgi:transcriptional regulator with PAS, ATPase and Fis domain
VIGVDAAGQARLAASLGESFDLEAAADAGSAIDRFPKEPPVCVVVGPGSGGEEPADLRRLRRAAPSAPILLLPAGAPVEAVARLIRPAPAESGADEGGPREPRPGRFEDIVSQSPAMQKVLELARRMAENDSRILVTGETGTGKDLLARAIHADGLRRLHPFVPVNCAAIPEGLAESEFFGHEKGAFTGASRTKPGKFELAHRGTLFLDEITCLSQELQLKLLRVLQDGIVYRVGGETPLKVDVRIIAATNRDLQEEVAEGRFREDLYYRLKVVTLRLPALRERREDIPELLGHFLAVHRERFRRDIRGYTDAARELLCRYDWPGNVRELEHTVEYLVIMEHGNAITTQHLSTEILSSGLEEREPGGGALRQAREGFERRLVADALVRSGWNQTRAAELLGLSRNRLIAKMKKYDLEAPALPGGRKGAARPKPPESLGRKGKIAP